MTFFEYDNNAKDMTDKDIIKLPLMGELTGGEEIVVSAGSGRLYKTRVGQLLDYFEARLVAAGRLVEPEGDPDGGGKD